jgi:DNA-binding CsgD family transcriptional regulator
VLYRSNEVKQAAEDDAPAGSFSGNTGDGCGEPRPLTVSGAYGIGAFATANIPSDDIVLKLIGPGGGAVASSDTGTSPEAVNYTKQRRQDRRRHVPHRRLRVQRPDGPADGDSFDYTGGYAVNTVGGAPSTAGNPSWQSAAVGPARVGDPHRLTSRERDVLRLLADGRSNAQIAGELCISPKTASVHVSSIIRKLGVASRGEAAAVAHRLGLVT